MTIDRDRVATALPAYEIGRELGRGGFGVVLEGRHRHLGRDVAIKELPRAFAADPAVRTRFLAEARILASLDHPHIVPVFDYVDSGGLCLLVMERLPGGTVWEHFTGTGLTMEQACAVALVACTALHFAHQRGILHRDVKPENLIYSATQVLKVTDFGLAKVLNGMETMATDDGEVVGTPAYMAPEQARGEALTPATDVYAVGVMLYELLSGQLPFPEGDPMSVLFSHVFDQPRPLTETAPHVPRVIADVAMRALATSPEDRFPSAEELGLALAEAATRVWQPGWVMTRGGTRVVAASPIVSVTERPSAETLMVGTASAPPEDGGTGVDRRNDASPPTRMVRPTVKSHVAAPMRSDMRLVPVHRVLMRMRASRPLLAGTAGFLALMVLTAVLGMGSSGSRHPLGAGSMMAGVEVASGKPVRIDPSKPIDVLVHGPAAAAAAADADPSDSLELVLSVVGLRLGAATAPVTPTTGQALAASIDVSASRHVLAGEVTGQLILLRRGREAAEWRFAVRSSRSPLRTVPGVFTIGLLPLVVAYASWLLRSLRRGRQPRSGTIRLTAAGTLIGLLMVSVTWIGGVHEPTLATLAVCGLLGGGAGLVAAAAFSRAGGRRRRPAVA